MTSLHIPWPIYVPGQNVFKHWVEGYQIAFHMFREILEFSIVKEQKTVYWIKGPSHSLETGPCRHNTVPIFPILMKYNKWAVTCDFQQCGILTSVDLDEPV